MMKTRSPPEMALRSGSSPKLSFDLLPSGDGDDEIFFSDPARTDPSGADAAKKAGRRNRRNKNSRRKIMAAAAAADPATEEPRVERLNGAAAAASEGSVQESEVLSGFRGSCATGVDLRQRAVNGCSNSGGGAGDGEKDGSVAPSSSSGSWRPEANEPARSETAGSLDWNRLMEETSNDIPPGKRLPWNYFMGEIYAGNSLRTTTSIGNEKNRQRVYNTMFHVPWRCELLIDVGFFVCLDSFLSLLTIMPARIAMTLWRFLRCRQFHRPSAAELSDFGCFVVLSCGIALLQKIDISFIYHIIRGQGTIKLYVVYNVLEILDKLCQSFGGDVLQVLFNSADGLASCLPENMKFQLLRFILDQTIAVVAFICHSCILLAEAITLSTCIVAHNNALMALLVSNNFSEIKSNVFKRLSKDNIHSIAYSDTVERFHMTAFLLFVLAQNILEAEGPWFWSFLTNALLVYMCEVLVDVLKHSFLAKFNEINPATYSEFLEALCKQTLTIDSENGRNALSFVPIAPACVVIRVLTPIYAAHLPYGPFPWRLFWIILLSGLTYFMVAVLKIMVGLGVHLHAKWYVNRREKRKHHFD